MLGWHITVERFKDDTDKIYYPDAHSEYKTRRIAGWYTGLGGTDWLDQLVKAGKAEFLGGEGYPCSYRAKAKLIFSLISQGIPTGKNPVVIGDNYVMPENWSSDIDIYPENIQKCEPEEWLLIEAMDQS